MVKYLASSYPLIKKVEIEKETKNFIQLKGHNTKDAKETQYSKYCDTFDDAVDFLKQRSFKNIETSEKRLEHAKLEHEKLIADIIKLRKELNG